jgi:hypothetical protein
VKQVIDSEKKDAAAAGTSNGKEAPPAEMPIDIDFTVLALALVLKYVKADPQETMCRLFFFLIMDNARHLHSQRRKPISLVNQIAVQATVLRQHCGYGGVGVRTLAHVLCLGCLPMRDGRRVLRIEVQGVMSQSYNALRPFGALGDKAGRSHA